MRSKASIGTFSPPYEPAGILLLLVWGAAVACDAPQPATDARIDRLETQIETLGSTVERIDGQVAVLSEEPTAAPSPTRTPTPSPTAAPTATPLPSPGPTLEDIAALVEERVTAAITAIPTQQSVVIQAGDVTLEMLEGLIDAKVSEAVAESIARLPTSTAVPAPPPTPGPILAEVEALIASRLSSALASIPTPTSLDELRALVDERVAAATGPVPTPTQTVATPTPGSVGGQVFAASVAALSEDIFLTLDPGHGLAGRDIRFSLEGVRPWQPVEVEFADPRDESVEWITQDEARFVRTNGRPVTKQTMVADGSGRATWIRIGTEDVEGVWFVRVTVDGETSTVRYPISQLQLPPLELFTSGIEFRKYKGSVSDAYISTLVPSSLAVDIQAHIGWIVERLDVELGIRSGTIPDIYLTGNRGLLETVSDATGAAWASRTAISCGEGRGQASTCAPTSSGPPCVAL